LIDVAGKAEAIDIRDGSANHKKIIVKIRPLPALPNRHLPTLKA